MRGLGWIEMTVLAALVAAVAAGVMVFGGRGDRETQASELIGR